MESAIFIITADITLMIPGVMRLCRNAKRIDLWDLRLGD